jgi:hypothetical protein
MTDENDELATIDAGSTISYVKHPCKDNNMIYPRGP